MYNMGSMINYQKCCWVEIVFAHFSWLAAALSMVGTLPMLPLVERITILNTRRDETRDCGGK